MADLDRGHYGGVGHRSSQRRLTSAFDVDTLEREKKAARPPTWAERVHADPCEYLMGREPMALALRIAGKR